MHLVVQSGSRVWGGVEKWFGAVAEGMLARGHRVSLSGRPRGPVRERLEAMGVGSTTRRPRGDADVLNAWLFARWLRRERPDVLLLTNWNRLYWGARAGRWGRVPRIVVRLGLFEAPDGPHLSLFAFRGRRAVDAIIANSTQIRDDFLAAVPSFPAERVHVIFNGIEPRDPLSTERRERLRAEVGGEDAAPLFVAAGHAFPRKGFDVLIRAFARAALPGAEACVVGEGGHVPELKELAASLGVDAGVRFAGARSDAADVIAAADVFVLSSRHEGMANVMLEAMAAGTPVIATDVSGVREAIGARGGRPEAGWIVPSDDPAAMAEAMRTVAAALRDDPAAVRARTEEARWRIVHWFGMERMLDRVEEVLFGTPEARDDG